MIWILVAVLGCGLQLALLATHPEPRDDDPDLVHKPSYRSLVTWKSALALFLASTGLGLLTANFATHIPGAWAVWAGCGLVWIWCDAKTTWLPLRCTWVTWAGLIILLLISHDGSGSLISIPLGALSAGALFWLFWRFSGALGFGDVHIAAILGALGASYGLTGWSTALLAGTTLAALWGLITALWRRHHPHPLGKVFPYGPGLWAGAWAAMLLPAVGT